MRNATIMADKVDELADDIGKKFGGPLSAVRAQLASEHEDGDTLDDGDILAAAMEAYGYYYTDDLYDQASWESDHFGIQEHVLDAWEEDPDGMRELYPDFVDHAGDLMLDMVDAQDRFDLAVGSTRDLTDPETGKVHYFHF